MSLDDRLDQEAVGWRPEPGDKLVGRIVDLSERDSDFGDPYPLLEVEKEDGQLVAVHAFHTVLKNELAKKRPEVGDTIGIKYLGVPAGKRYEAYRVVVERAQAGSGPNWDMIGAKAADELADSGEHAQPVDLF